MRTTLFRKIQCQNTLIITDNIFPIFHMKSSFAKTHKQPIGFLKLLLAIKNALISYVLQQKQINASNVFEQNQINPMW